MLSWPSAPRAAVLLATTVLPAMAACADDSDSPELSPQAEDGRAIASRAGCTACHGNNGQGGAAPAFARTFGTEIELEDGSTVTVDEAYLTTAIADPGAQVHSGFTISMPENELSDEEVGKVVDYIVELNSSQEATG